MFKFSDKSFAHLVGVRPELVSVAALALSRSPIDFGIVDGMRTVEEQAKYLASGASKTMESKHLDGRAIDIMAYVNGKGRWEQPLYVKIHDEAFISAAADAGVALVWGGDWGWDFGHYELAEVPPATAEPVAV